jgi:hypothetical protein
MSQRLTCDGGLRCDRDDKSAWTCSTRALTKPTTLQKAADVKIAMRLDERAAEQDDKAR